MSVTIALSKTATLAALPHWTGGTVCVTAVALFCILFRPGSTLWRRRFTISSRAQRISLALFALFQCAVFLAASLIINSPSQTETVTYNANFSHWMDPLQYQRLGDALIHHRTWLDLPVDPTLEVMDNPYDYADRVARQQTTGAVYYWDHAYFQGKYYCYFGVIPAVLLFAPYELLTGRWLSTWAATMILTCLFVCLAVPLIARLIQRLYPDASIALTWLVMIAAMTANACWYYDYLPSFYGIPTLTSMCMTAAGLLLWVNARRDRTSRRWAWTAKAGIAARTSEDWTPEPGLTSAARAACSPTVLSAWRVVLGAMILSLNLGSRPQFVLSLLLAAPLFWHEIVHTRQLFSLTGLRVTAATFIGATAAVTPLLWYNAVRFGSPFDTGATYNLTSYDITAWHFPREGYPSALFYQLFSPVRMDWGFPFIQMTNPDTPYPHEPFMGGMFAIIPFLTLAFLAPLAHRALAARHTRGYVWLSLAVTILIALADISFGGINTRYWGDYSLLVTFAAGCVAFAVEDAHPRTIAEIDPPAGGRAGEIFAAPQLSDRVLLLLVAFLVALGAVIQILGLFTTGRYEPLIARDPHLWAVVENWFGPLLS